MEFWRVGGRLYFVTRSAKGLIFRSKRGGKGGKKKMHTTKRRHPYAR